MEILTRPLAAPTHLRNNNNSSSMLDHLLLHRVNTNNSNNRGLQRQKKSWNPTNALLWRDNGGRRRCRVFPLVLRWLNSSNDNSTISNSNSSNHHQLRPPLLSHSLQRPRLVCRTIRKIMPRPFKKPTVVELKQRPPWHRNNSILRRRFLVLTFICSHRRQHHQLLFSNSIHHRPCNTNSNTSIHPLRPLAVKT